MLCSFAQKDQNEKNKEGKKTPRKDGGAKGRKNEKEEERVIIGCKISVKESASVQIYINIEKGLLLCIVDGKI